jgi:hypothetical protein
MPTRCYRCHYCGRILPAWLPMAKRPNGAMLLGHLSGHAPHRGRSLPGAHADGWEADAFPVWEHCPTWRVCGRRISGRWRLKRMRSWRCEQWRIKNVFLNSHGR